MAQKGSETKVTQLMARYFLKDKKKEAFNVEEYLAVLDVVLKKVKNNPMDTLEDIQSAMSLAKSEGLSNLNESTSTYVSYDSLGKSTPALGSKEFIRFFIAKAKVLSSNRKDYDFNSFVEVLKFFNIISDKLDVVTEEMVDKVFDLSPYDHRTFKQSTTENETYYFYENERQIKLRQKTVAESIISLTKSMADVNVTVGKFFKNQYGNTLASLKVTLDKVRTKNKSASFIVYVPVSIKGVYSLGYNSFIQNKSAEDYISGVVTRYLQRHLHKIVSQIRTLAKSYYFGEEDIRAFRLLLQSSLNRIFYVKEKFVYTKSEERMDLRMGLRPELVKSIRDDYEFSFSLFSNVSTKEHSLTDAEIVYQHHNCYYKEHTNVANTKGSNILKNFGKCGYEKYHGLPMNIKYSGVMDTTLVNAKANYSMSYLTTETNKVTITEMLNAFSVYNFVGVRNTLSPYIVGHALEIENQERDTKLTSYVQQTKLIDELNIPGYNSFFVLTDFQDEQGFDTSDGAMILNKRSPKINGMHDGDKLAFDSFSKGICKFSDTDDLFFLHPETKEEMPLNAMSPLNAIKRKTFGIFTEGLYNAKKFLEGNTTPEYRDFCKEPLLNEELLEFQEVFNRVDGEIISMGKLPVCLMHSYFVRQSDSMFDEEDLEDLEDSNDSMLPEDKTFSGIKKYKAGSEWNRRNILMCASDIHNYLMGRSGKLEEKIMSVTDHTKKLYGKKGALVQNLFQKKVPGLLATAVPNSSLKRDEIMAIANGEHFKELMKLTLLIDKNFDVESATKDFNAGKRVSILIGLLLRNPSINDANTIFSKASVIKGGNKLKNMLIAVNPITWSVMGGDFDGDQAIFLAFMNKISKSLEFHYTYKHHARLVNLAFGYRIEEMTGYSLRETYKAYPDNLYDFIKFGISVLKSDEEENEKLLSAVFDKEGNFNVISREQLVKDTTAQLLVTRISKQLIGVSKTVTMRALDFITDYLLEHGLLTVEIGKKVRSAADAMNEELVQPTIDIQKWSDNLMEVVKTVLTAYRMTEFVGILIELNFYPTYKTFKNIEEIMIKSGYVKFKTVMVPGTSQMDHTATGYYVNEDRKESSNKLEYGYQKELLKYIIGNSGKLFDGNGKLTYSTEGIGWNYTEDKYALLESMVEVINPKGKIYKFITDSVESDVEGMDLNAMFYLNK